MNDNTKILTDHRGSALTLEPCLCPAPLDKYIGGGGRGRSLAALEHAPRCHEISRLTCWVGGRFASFCFGFACVHKLSHIVISARTRVPAAITGHDMTYIICPEPLIWYDNMYISIYLSISESDSNSDSGSDPATLSPGWLLPSQGRDQTHRLIGL